MKATVEAQSDCLEKVVDARSNRREFIQAMGAAGLALPMVSLFSAGCAPRGQPVTRPVATGPTFKEVSQGLDDVLHVAEGYRDQVLIRWGDPVLPGAPGWTPGGQSASAQLQQFGFNCDFIAYLPLEPGDAGNRHGLLCVNHEYTRSHMMFSGYPNGAVALEKATRQEVDTEMAAIGHTVIELEKRDGQWSVIEGKYNRRISLLETEIELAGPVRGHRRVQTHADPRGQLVRGTLANCSGGITPWGTILICEENIEKFFGFGERGGPEERTHERYDVIKPPVFPFSRHHERFDLRVEPREANRFGWVVEYDPRNPTSRPVKRTALGRVLRESATVTLAPSGQVVVYSGDDRKFEYIYRFVSRDRFDPSQPDAGRDLLDDGTLYVAKCEVDGRLVWLPLVYGQGGLTEANGFSSQVDVLIEARRAADVVGATPMDRPEDIDVSPVSGRVYVMLTKNPKRSSSDVNPANSRAENHYGQILEMLPPPTDGGAVDHAAPEFRWDIFLMAGDPDVAEHGARYGAGLSREGVLSNPDNCTFDPMGRLWIATDGAESALETADGLWACDTDGEYRAVTRRFLRCPAGAELCSPHFTPDGKTLFASIQHPGASKGASYDAPSSRWPDFREDRPPRPSVIVIEREDGGPIGA